MKKVFVTDLDGTLLDEKGQLSENSRKILTNLITTGTYFTIASARSIDSIRAVVKDLPLNMPVIEFNGSYITDFNTGEKIVVNCIDRKCNEKIYSIINSHKLSMIATCHENNQDYLYYNIETLSEGALDYIRYRIDSGDQRLNNVNKMEQIIEKDIICFNVIDLKDKIKAIHDELIEEFGEKLEVHMMKGTYTEKWYWLNVADKKGTKGYALKTFKEMFLINTDKLFVFGDNNNDLGMFEVADTSIAVENGIDELKKIAKETIGYNYEDSVAKYILKKVGE